MERKVRDLEGDFQNAQMLLVSIQSQLESEFAIAHPHSSHMNPFKARHRLEQLKKDFALAKERNSKILALKQEYIRSIGLLLKSNVELFTCIQESVGATSTLQQVELKKYEMLCRNFHFGTSEFLNISAQADENSVRESESDMLNTDVEFVLRSEMGLLHIDPTAETSKSCLNEKINNDNKENIPKTRKRGQLRPITKEEFESVSELIRGRKLTLQQVNEVYKDIYDYFRELKSLKKLTPSSAMSVQEMTRRGLKVTGASGEAKLKTLRSLKRIKLNNKNEAQLT